MTFSGGQPVGDDIQISLFDTVPKELEKERRTVSYDKKVLMDAIATEVRACTLCRLHSTRLNAVPGEGSFDARIMFVGEGPGADEDAKGRPFVGAAGRLLDAIIAAMGMKREEVFIGNIVKCRPPNNRIPEKDETESCIRYLRRQIEIIDPKIIVLLGATAYKSMIDNARDGITKVRGQVLLSEGRAFMPTFHPAALLRDPSKKHDVWVDMKKVISMLREDS